MNTIKKAKENKWRELCRKAEEDPWGLAYKIVNKRLGYRPPKLDPELEKEIIQKLFPQATRTNRFQQGEEDGSREKGPPFSEEELQTAIKRSGTKKAPGPDGIPAAVVKKMTEAEPINTLNMLNALLARGEFPNIWKTARVILIPKPRKSPEEDQKFRPICLLDEWGKLYERLVRARLEEALEQGGGLATTQFGFRKGRGTIDALEMVHQMAKKEMEKPHQGGSILGPTLWNVLYDDVLRLRFSYWLSPSPNDLALCAVAKTLALWAVAKTLALCAVAKTLALWAVAKTLALCAVAKTPEEIVVKLKRAMIKILQWMQTKGLTLASEKTEAVCLPGRKRIRPLVLRVGGVAVPVKEEVKYLGVIFDRKMTFVPHITEQLAKARRLTENLRRPLPRYRGPSEHKRRLYKCVSESILLYASCAKAWTVWLRAGIISDALQVVGKIKLPYKLGNKIIIGDAYVVKESKLDLKTDGILSRNFLFKNKIHFCKGNRKIKHENMEFDLENLPNNRSDNVLN
ncbi:UNVERIFIED_CONTAM: hypothetical protein PYX00_008499 [Menopon gallinae]|uniref:Reverse transcriptase domain-containing protein n=1 Tax=Menopon gallinae TaxID=328185 RepID=A0AAW2HPW8_9NEOP